MEKNIKANKFLELCYLTFEENEHGKDLLKYMIDDRILNTSFQGDMSDRLIFMELGKQELIKSIRKAIEVFKGQKRKSK